MRETDEIQDVQDEIHDEKIMPKPGIRKNRNWWQNMGQISDI